MKRDGMRDGMRGAFVSVLATVIFISACAPSGGTRRRGGVDWNTFNYKSYEQLPRDNDTEYTLPAGGYQGVPE